MRSRGKEKAGFEMKDPPVRHTTHVDDGSYRRMTWGRSRSG
jgi:hypothetical protein